LRPKLSARRRPLRSELQWSNSWESEPFHVCFSGYWSQVLLSSQWHSFRRSHTARTPSFSNP
jgi:hypothetical protein